MRRRGTSGHLRSQAWPSTGAGGTWGAGGTADDDASAGPQARETAPGSPRRPPGSLRPPSGQAPGLAATPRGLQSAMRRCPSGRAVCIRLPVLEQELQLRRISCLAQLSSNRVENYWPCMSENQPSGSGRGDL